MASAAIGPVATAVVVGALCVVAAAELFASQRARGPRPIPFAGFLGVIGLIAIAAVRGDRAVVVFPIAIAGAFALASTTLLIRGKIEGAAMSIATTVFDVVAVGSFGAYIVVLRRLAHGTGLVIGLVIIAAAGDVASTAVAAVRPMGWQRRAAGVAASMIAAVIVGSTMSAFTPRRAVILGVIVAILVPAGELAVGILEGERRVLDRTAGLLLAAPAFFFVYRALVR